MEDELDLNINAADSIRELERLTSEVDKARKSLERFNKVNPNAEFERHIQELSSIGGGAGESVKALNKIVKEYNLTISKIKQSTRDGKVIISPTSDQLRKIGKYENDLNKILKIQTDLEDRSSAISPSLPRLSDDLSLEIEGVQHDLRGGQLKKGVRDLDIKDFYADQLRKQEEFLATRMANDTKALNQAHRMNKEFDQRMLDQKNKVHEKALSLNRSRDKMLLEKASDVHLRALRDNEKFNKQISQRESKNLNERIRRIRQFQSLQIKLGKEDRSLIKTIKEKISLNGQLSESERKLASALDLANRRVKLQNGLLSKSNNSIEELKLTVSRARNFTLLYAFAVEGLIDPFRNIVNVIKEYEGATFGAIRVGEKFGFQARDTQDAIDSLTKDGILKATDASKGLRNLLSSGIGLDDATRLMEAFKDSAAFNRQGTLEFGESIVGATEGVKNMNSRMVDNAGISKNLSIIISEYAASMGRTTASLSEAERQQAVVNGLIRESQVFAGDASLASQSLTGAFTSMEVAGERALRVIGDTLESKIGLFSNFANLMSGVANSFVVIAEDENSSKARSNRNLKELGVSDDRINRYNSTLKVPGDLISNQSPIDFKQLLPGVRESYNARLDEIIAEFNTTGAPTKTKRKIEDLHKAANSYFKGQIELISRKSKNANIDDADLFAKIGEAGSVNSFQLGNTAKNQVEITKKQIERLRLVLDDFKKVMAAFALGTRDTGLALSVYKDLENQVNNYIRSMNRASQANLNLRESASNPISSEALSFIDSIENKLERFESKGVIDRYDRQIERDTTKIKQLIELAETKGEALKIPRDSIANFKREALQALDAANAVTQDSRFKALSKTADSISQSIESRNRTPDKFRDRERNLQSFIDKTTENIEEYLKRKGADVKIAEAMLVTLAQKSSEEAIKIQLDEEHFKFKIKVDGMMAFEERRREELKKTTDQDLRDQIAAIKNRDTLRQLTPEGRKRLAFDEANVEAFELTRTVKDFEEFIKIIDLLNKKFEESELQRNLNEIDLKFKGINESVGRVVTGAGQVNGAFQLASEVGIRSFNILGRRIDKVSSSLQNATQSALQFSQAQALLNGGGVLNTLSGISTGLGAAGLAVTAGLSLYSAFKGEKDKSEKEKDRSNRFGSTLTRGPQTININPTLAVQADGDVFFAQDSETVIRDRLIGLVQQSIDDGEIDFGSIRG